MDKKAKGKMNAFGKWFLGILAAIALVVFIAGQAGVFTGTTTEQSGLATQTGNVQTQSLTCPYAPTYAAVGSDAITNGGVTINSQTYNIAGTRYANGSTVPIIVNQAWDVVADATGYLADEQKFTAGCVNAPIFKPYAYANATVTFKDDPVTSSNTLTNGGGALNATQINGQRNLPVILQGTSQKSTSTIFWLVESPTGMAVNLSATGLTASCNNVQLSPATIPSAIAATNAGSLRAAFEIPAIVGSSSTNCNLQIQTTATGVASGLFKNTFYAEQKYIDSTGTVQTGIYDTTPNGNNAVQYQDTYTYNVYLK